MAIVVCNTPQIMRRKQVQAVTGLSRSSIYALIKADRFPKQVKLSARSVGWVQEQVQAFLVARIAESQAQLKGGA